MRDCPKLPNALWERYDRGGCAPKEQRVQGTIDREEYMMPVLEAQALDSLLAEAIYSSGVAFSFVSNC